MRTETLTHTARWHISLGAVFCLLAILPFGYAQSITELKSKAEDDDVPPQLALAKAYHLGEGVEVKNVILDDLREIALFGTH